MHPPACFNRLFFCLSIPLVSLIGVTGGRDATIAQETVPSLASRSLQGTVDFGTAGRQVVAPGNLLHLGSLTLTSERLPGEDSNEDGTVDSPIASPPISVSGSGYAYLENGLLIKSADGADFQFTAADQSHTFDVYRIGTGAYDLRNEGLTGSTSFRTANDETVTSYGGNWHWTADYNTISGSTSEEEVLPRVLFDHEPSVIDPVMVQPVRSGVAIEDSLNRTNSSRPLPSARISASPLNLRLDETVEPTIERRNALFRIDGVTPETEQAPTLNLNVAISGAGSSIDNRKLTGQTHFISLGRHMRKDGNLHIDREDTVMIRTTSPDDAATRLALDDFDLEKRGGDGAVRATREGTGAIRFDNAFSNAEVSLSANLSINLNAQAGQHNRFVEAGNSIKSLENLPSQRTQDSLQLGYRYNLLDNNDLMSSDITAFVLSPRADGQPLADRIDNQTVKRVYSISTHTAIGFDRAVAPTEDAVRTITLKPGDGVRAEGLPGEILTASTSYQLHQKFVDRTELSFTEPGVIAEGGEITISHTTAANKDRAQASAYLVGDRTIGSSRWRLDGLTASSLAPGDTLSLMPIFDDAGLPSSEEFNAAGGELGRNFRTQIDLTFQDGSADLGDIEPDTVRAEAAFWNDSQSSLFNIVGSRESRQTLSYQFERSYEVEASQGEAILDAGTTLGSEGINLSNLVENTSTAVGSVPTTLRLLDSSVLQDDTEIAAQFYSLDDISQNMVDGIANTDTSRLSSDVLDLIGLDGILHVVELSYDVASHDNQELLWLNEQNVWVNAVLGNSDINPSNKGTPETESSSTDFDNNKAISIDTLLDERRHDVSYADYLAARENGRPSLGDFGTADGRAWAVVNHNSRFAVGERLQNTASVPEPGSCGLLAALLATAAAHRRRSLAITL